MDFVAALGQSGARTVVIDASGPQTWILGRVKIKSGDLTVQGDPDVTMRESSIMIKAPNVILRELAIGTGDQGLSSKNAASWDAIALQARDGVIVENVVIQCVTGIWGPDIGGLAMLGDVRNVTVQDSILGEGLYLSKHPEANPAEDGHSLAVNLSAKGAQHGGPDRITFARNLVTRSDGRMPKFSGGRSIEGVNNLVYGWGSRAPEGNADSINWAGNYLIPSAQSVELLVWSPRLQTVVPEYIANSVWVNGNVLQGVGGDELVGEPATVYRSTPGFTPSHAYLSAAAARDHVLANAGGVRSAWEQRIVDDVLAGASRWYNGAGSPAPNPEWP